MKARKVNESIELLSLKVDFSRRSVFNVTFQTIYCRERTLVPNGIGAGAPPTTSVIQFKCLRIIGNHPRRTPTSNLHNSLNIEPVRVLIHRLADKFFAHCHLHPNPLVQQIGNCTVADLTNLCKKYKHKRTKHILL
jgi:hypothetical protein